MSATLIADDNVSSERYAQPARSPTTCSASIICLNLCNHQSTFRRTRACGWRMEDAFARICGAVRSFRACGVAVIVKSAAAAAASSAPFPNCGFGCFGGLDGSADWLRFRSGRIFEECGDYADDYILCSIVSFCAIDNDIVLEYRQHSLDIYCLIKQIKQ